MPLLGPLVVVVDETVLAILTHLLPFPAAPQRRRVLFDVLERGVQRFAQYQIAVVQTPHGQRGRVQQTIAVTRCHHGIERATHVLPVALFII